MIQRGAVVVQARLDLLVNITGLDTNDDGTLAESAASTIDADLTAALENALVPQHARAVVATVSRTEAFFSTKTLRTTMVIEVSPPARTVIGSIGPGKVTANVGGGAGISEG